MRHLHDKEEVYDNVVVYKIEGLGPVNHQVHHGLGRVGLVSIAHYEVDDVDQGMGAGVARKGILVWGKILGHIVEKTIHTLGATKNDALKPLTGPLCKAEGVYLVKPSGWEGFVEWHHILYLEGVTVDILYDGGIVYIRQQFNEEYKELREHLRIDVTTAGEGLLLASLTKSALGGTTILG